MCLTVSVVPIPGDQTPACWLFRMCKPTVRWGRKVTGPRLRVEAAGLRRRVGPEPARRSSIVRMRVPRASLRVRVLISGIAASLSALLLVAPPGFGSASPDPGAPGPSTATAQPHSSDPAFEPRPGSARPRSSLRPRAAPSRLNRPAHQTGRPARLRPLALCPPRSRRATLQEPLLGGRALN